MTDSSIDFERLKDIWDHGREKSWEDMKQAIKEEAGKYEG